MRDTNADQLRQWRHLTNLFEADATYWLGTADFRQPAFNAARLYFAVILRRKVTTCLCLEIRTARANAIKSAVSVRLTSLNAWNTQHI